MKFIESETLELKKSTSEIKEAVISIVSILNKNQHGELFFGIKNNGTVIGQNVTGKTLRDVSKSIADNIEPKLYPHISHIKTDRKSYGFWEDGFLVQYFQQWILIHHGVF